MDEMHGKMPAMQWFFVRDTFAAFNQIDSLYSIATVCIYDVS